MMNSMTSTVHGIYKHKLYNLKNGTKRWVLHTRTLNNDREINIRCENLILWEIYPIFRINYETRREVSFSWAAIFAKTKLTELFPFRMGNDAISLDLSPIMVWLFLPFWNGFSVCHLEWVSTPYRFFLSVTLSRGHSNCIKPASIVNCCSISQVDFVILCV